MRNKEIAAALSEIADLFEVKGELQKPSAYRRAARSIEAFSEDVERLSDEKRLMEIPGVGEAIAEKVTEYLTTGKIPLLEELRGLIPSGVIGLMAIPGVGPKTTGLLWHEMGITSIDELRRAAEEHRLRRLKGFGEKKEEKILKGIRFLAESGKRIPIGIALPLAEEIVHYLKEKSPGARVGFAGSVRRMKESAGDLDILAASPSRSSIVRSFTSMPHVREVILAGDTKATVILDSGIQTDLRVLDENSWGAGLQYFTGSKDHNVHLRTIAQGMGLKLNEYGVFRGDQQVAGSTEEGVYEALGLHYIEPELREDAGEIEAAQSGRLPRLVGMPDIRGDLHIHTNATDGADTLEAMTEAARQLGYEYAGISDHSRSLLVARGLSVESLLKRKEEIRSLSREIGFPILIGTECEILANGELDYPEDVLKELDYVIAAIHSRLNAEADEMTERIVTAIKHPCVNILAHPFTGLVNRREPIQMDFETVADQAAENDTALEINAFPDRLDLSGPRARLAKEKGAKLVINTDSHSVDHLGFMRFGVGQARRGWLGRDDILNCWSLDQVRKFFSR